MERQPTARQIEAARAVAALAEQLGHAPTLLEVGQVLGVSFAAARKLLHRGRDHGLVTFEPNQARTLRVIDHRAIRRKDRGGA